MTENDGSVKQEAQRRRDGQADGSNEGIDEGWEEGRSKVLKAEKKESPKAPMMEQGMAPKTACSTAQRMVEITDLMKE